VNGKGKSPVRVVFIDCVVLISCNLEILIMVCLFLMFVHTVTFCCHDGVTLSVVLYYSSSFHIRLTS
jgi:hypothetical protein